METTPVPSRVHHWIEIGVTCLSLSVPLFLILGRAIADISMGIVSLTFLFQCLVDRKWQWVRTPWFLLALVTWGYMLLSGALADFEKKEAITSALVWMRFPIFAMAFSQWVLPGKKAQKYLMPSLIFLLVLVSVDTIWQFVFGTSLSGHPKPDYAGRLTGPLNRMLVGVFLLRLCWPAIGFSFAWAVRRVEEKKYLFAPLFFTALIGITILISGERVAFALFGLCALLFLAGARGLRIFIATVGIAGALSALLLIFSIPSLQERLISNTYRNVSHLGNSAYAAVWTNGFKAWQHSPIFGIGPNNFVPMCEQMGADSGFLNENRDLTELKCTRHPHNIYLEWAAETGLIGLSLFIGMVFLWLREGWRNYRMPQLTLDEYYQRLGLVIGLIPFLWPIMSSMSFFTNWSAVLFWWVLGLVLQSNRQTV